MASNLAGICGGRVKALWPLPAGRRANPPLARRPADPEREARARQTHRSAAQLSGPAGGGRPRTGPGPHPALRERSAPAPETAPAAAAGGHRRANAPGGPSRPALDFETGRRHRPPRSAPPSRTPGRTRPALPAAGGTLPLLPEQPGGRTVRRGPELGRAAASPAASTDGEPQPPGTAALAGGRAALPRPGRRRRRRRGPPWRGRRARPDQRRRRRLLAQTDAHRPRLPQHRPRDAPRTKMAARSVSAAHVSAAPHKDGGARLPPHLARPAAGGGCPA